MPDKYTDKKKTEMTLRKIENALIALREGASIVDACKGAQISRNALYEWRYQDPANRELMDKILDARSMVVEDALYKSAVKGNTTAQIFWLVNRTNRWRNLNEQKNTIDLKMKSDKDVAKYIKETIFGGEYYEKTTHTLQSANPNDNEPASDKLPKNKPKNKAG